MKYLLLFSMVFGSFNSYALIGNDMLFSYEENYPNSPHWYEFELSSFCGESRDPISIQQFTSEKIYDNESVRIVHIYAKANNKNCENLVSESKTKKVVIPVDPKRMTHIYVTYSSQLTETSGH